MIVARWLVMKVSGPPKRAPPGSRLSEVMTAFFGAEIVWVAVTVDTTTKTFSAYAGDMSQLPSPKYIPMRPDRDLDKYDCLARDVRDGEISASWSNIEQTVSANEDQP
jgi:hypothetical protein